MDILYLTPPIFFLIAFVFSMLGMGGAQLYIPILFWLGMDFKSEAIPLGLLLNLVNSSTAAVTYARKRMINWPIAIPFGLAMLLFPPLGAWLNAQLAVKPLLILFAMFTAAAAVLMLAGWTPKGAPLSTRKRTLLGLSTGGALGFVTGLIGRGGGSFAVPLLYIAGLDAQTAAATSALVITMAGISSFVSHMLGAAQPQWIIWIACAASVFLGSFLGSRLMANRLKPRNVRFIFGWVLLGVAALIIIKDVILG